MSLQFVGAEAAETPEGKEAARAKAYADALGRVARNTVRRKYRVMVGARSI